MKIKSYYSRTVEDAMAAARQRWDGRDASEQPQSAAGGSPSWRVQSGLGQRRCIVTPAETNLKLPDERSKATTVPQAPGSDRLATEVAELKREFEGMRARHARTAYAPAQWIGVSQEAFVPAHGVW